MSARRESWLRSAVCREAVEGNLLPMKPGAQPRKLDASGQISSSSGPSRASSAATAGLGATKR